MDQILRFQQGCLRKILKCKTTNQFPPVRCKGVSYSETHLASSENRWIKSVRAMVKDRTLCIYPPHHLSLLALFAAMFWRAVEKTETYMYIVQTSQVKNSKHRKIKYIYRRNTFLTFVAYLVRCCQDLWLPVFVISYNGTCRFRYLSFQISTISHVCCFQFFFLLMFVVSDGCRFRWCLSFPIAATSDVCRFWWLSLLIFVLPMIVISNDCRF